ncbi:hypothetical protein SORBI_3001G409000 [Sorghum bicolor]|uniref:Uncharacterized protein n=1 Tax=Sorghum bicolor TaxID=4558 RepID=C5WNK0_SORBI|nr:hypothetical protein SORBI_3001G409000 [Sorghum bicolor]
MSAGCAWRRSAAAETRRSQMTSSVYCLRRRSRRRVDVINTAARSARAKAATKSGLLAAALTTSMHLRLLFHEAIRDCLDSAAALFRHAQPADILLHQHSRHLLRLWY